MHNENADNRPIKRYIGFFYKNTPLLKSKGESFFIIL